MSCVKCPAHARHMPGTWHTPTVITLQGLWDDIDFVVTVFTGSVCHPEFLSCHLP